MIDYKCNKGHVQLHVHGSTTEIGADILTLIHSIYNKMVEENEDEAEEFRYMLGMGIMSGEAFKSKDEIKSEVIRDKLAGMNEQELQKIKEWLEE